MLNKIKGGGEIPSKPKAKELVKGFLGGFIGILILMLLNSWSQSPWIMAHFGATCVLLFALPSSPLAQPRNVIGGHLVSSLVGLIIINLFASNALAVGVSITVMQYCRVVHPPAGADPILIIMTGINNFSFLVMPVLAGSVALVLVALVINNFDKESRWPVYWLGVKQKNRTDDN